MYTVVYKVQHPHNENVQLICTKHFSSKYLRGAIRQAYQNENRKIIKIIRAFES